MKKTYLRNLNRGIKRGFGRFASIIAIVFLGVSFLIGLLSTTPNLHNSVTKYYKESNVSFVNIKTTLGFKDTYETYLRENFEEIKEVELIYQEDKLSMYDGKRVVSRINYIDFNSYKINKLELLEGRCPQAKYECVILKDNDYLYGGNINEYIDVEGYDEKLKIVGIATSPFYFAKASETSTLGNGRLGEIVFLEESYYNHETLTDAYITLDYDSKNYFNDSFDIYLDSFKAKLDSKKDEMLALRVDELKDEIREEIYDEVNKKVIEEVTLKLKEQLKENGVPDSMIDSMLQTLLESEEVKNTIEDETSKAVEEVVEEEVGKLDKKLYFLTLSNANVSYISFKMNAKKVEEVSRIFPVFFFLICSLVTLITMTRMIEEERTQIGTLKALGYSKRTIRSKYIIYALIACVGGTLLGLAVGIFVLPYALYSMYNTLFIMPKFKLTFDAFSTIISSLLITISVLLVTSVLVNKTLKEKPSTLMLGKAPKPGKKILLERIPFIWNHLKFKYKSMFKNIFRYKKNIFVMLVGVGGCTSLLLLGFGIQDSVKDITRNQFDTIQKYDLLVGVEGDDDVLFDVDGIDSYSKCYLDSEVTLYSSTSDISSNLIGLNDDILEDIDSYVNFIDLDGNKIDFSLDKVYVSEQIATELGVKKGDEVSIEIESNKYSLTIDEVVQNYINNYIYTGIKTIDKITNKTNDANYYLVNVIDGVEDIDEIVTKITEKEGVTSIEVVIQTKSSFDFMLNMIVYIVLIIIGFSGALSIVVTYNLTNININERIKEIATLKVLGYQKKEVAMYIYRETMILTLFGTVIGMLITKPLLSYILEILSSPGILFKAKISAISYVISFLLSIVFAIIVDILFLKKLKNIKMVESLKCVD